jgi:hypothetical protein
MPLFNTSQEEKDKTFVDTILRILSIRNVSIEDFIKDALHAYKYVHKLYNGEFFNKVALDIPYLKMCLEKIIGEKPKKPKKPKKPTSDYTTQLQLYDNYPLKLREYTKKKKDFSYAYKLLTQNNADSYRNRYEDMSVEDMSVEDYKYEDYKTILDALPPCEQLISLVKDLVFMLDTFENCLNQLELVLKYLDSKNNTIWVNGIIKEWPSIQPDFSQFIVDTVLDGRNEKGIFKFLDHIINPKNKTFFRLTTKIVNEYKADAEHFTLDKEPTTTLYMKDKYTPHFKECLLRNIQSHLFTNIDKRIQNYQSNTSNGVSSLPSDSDTSSNYGWSTTVTLDNVSSVGKKKKTGLSSGKKKKGSQKKQKKSKKNNTSMKQNKSKKQKNQINN